MFRSLRKASDLHNTLSNKPLNQFPSFFSTSTNPRKLIKAQSSLPQSSDAFAYATQNLIGHVRMARQFQTSDFGKTYWDICTVGRQEESDSKSKPRWIPVLFQGDAADSVAHHVKEIEYAFIPGRVCAQTSPFSAQDQLEDAGHDDLATRDVSSEMKNNQNIIPLLPLKSSIFVHDALAAQLMYLVT